MRDNLKAAGAVPPRYPHAAHHIVAHTDRRALASQNHLKSFGIHADDASNGVFLRYEQLGQGANHRNIHSDLYYQQVDKRILATTSKDEAILALRDIANELELDIFPY